jgi:hypothetical protein
LDTSYGHQWILSWSELSIPEEVVMHRRLVVPVVTVLFLALAGFGLRAGVTAQDATADHPLVGTWLVDTDPAEPTNTRDTFLFTADGGYAQTDAAGGTTLGAWETTGATTATLTIVAAAGDDEGNNVGTVTIRATITVSPDGTTFTADYTIELIDPDGTSRGEAGPGQALGERLTVEAPGTPALSLDELFAGREGTPEATPAP